MSKFDAESSKNIVLDLILDQNSSNLSPKMAPRRAKGDPRAKEMPPKAGSKKPMKKLRFLDPPVPPLVFGSL